MRFTHIILENIRSHTHTEITLPPGRIVLTGDIGSGKSSILYAIEFALFGLLRGEQPSLLRQQARQGSVSLTFTIHGEEITITRRIKRTKQGIQQDSAVHWHDRQGEHVLTPSEARARIISLFNYPREYVKSNPLLYRYTIFTPQEQLKQILLAHREERLSLFRKLFQLDKYARARENTLLITRSIQPRHHDQLDSLRDQLREVKARLKAVEDHLSLAEERVQHAESTAAKAEAAYKQAREAYEHARRIQEERERITSLLTRLQDHLTRLREEKTRLPDDPLPMLREEASRLTQKRDKLRKREDDLQEEATRLAAVQARLQEKTMLLHERLRQEPPRGAIREARERLTQHERILARLEEALTQARKKHAQAEAEYEALRQRLHQLKENLLTARVCPLCGQPISTEHKQHLVSETERISRELERLAEALRQTRQEEAQLSQQYKEAQREVETSRASLREEEQKQQQYEAWQQEAAALRDQAAVLQENLSRAAERLAEARKEKESIRKEREACDHALDHVHERIRQAEQAQRLKQEEERLVQEKALLEEQLTKLPTQDLTRLAAERDHAEADWRKSLKDAEDARLLREKLRVQYEHLRLEEERLQQDVQQALREEATARADEQIKAWMQNMLIPITSRLEEHLLARILAEFSSRFTFWLRILLPQARASIQEDFTPLIYLDTAEPLGYESLSGGERSSVALAYRLALYDTLRMLNHAIAGVLILDEPTEGFSTAQVEALIHAFQHIHAEQLMLVTHEPLLAEAADTRIQLRKEGDTTFLTTTNE